MIANRDPDALRARVATLSAREDDPDARRAMAEALLRVAVIERGDDAGHLLRRAAELDPYRGEIWLLLARHERAADQPTQALERLDVAALLLPNDRRVALLRASVLCELARAARKTDLGDRAMAELEPVLAATPGDPEVVAAALEALAHGSPSGLRARGPVLMPRLQPGPGTERLLYLVLLAVPLDDTNALLFDAVRETAEHLGAMGAAAAARAKTMTADELCDRLDGLAPAIAEPRIVRLLLRERLATVLDPARRLSLFERALAKAPATAIDGLSHDYMQLLHMVAMRALAQGDASTARQAWEACLARDKDNLAVLENLWRLAVATGRGDDARELAPRIAELRPVYASFSPRADLVFLRAAAQSLSVAAARLDRAAIQLDEAPPLVDALARGFALGRLARDASARTATAPATVRVLLDPSSEASAMFEAAAAVIAQPLFDEPPVAYAYAGLAKDATAEQLNEAYASTDPASRTVVSPLLDPVERAAYDARTCGTELGELLRAQARMVSRLLQALAKADGLDVPARGELIAKVRRLAPDGVMAYLRAATRTDGDGAADALFHKAVFGSVVEAAREDFAAGKIEAGLDRLTAHGELATGYAEVHDLIAANIACDSRLAIEEAAEQARDHARRGTKSSALLAAMASEDDDTFRERIAMQRAVAMVDRKLDRQALDALWWAHPATEGKMPSAGLPVLAWLAVAREGTARFRLSTARTMHAVTRHWYESQRMSSPFAAAETCRSAMLALRTAFWWVTAAREVANEDREVTASADQLLDLLALDRQHLVS